MTYYGTACSDRIGIGTAVVLKEHSLDFSKVEYKGALKEREKFSGALEQFCGETTGMAKKLAAGAGDAQAEILNGQLAMINDPFMADGINERIDGGQTAESAVASVCDMFIDMFSAADDELTRQRATDINDIKTRMLKIMLGISDTDLSALPPGTVIAAKDFTPSMTSEINSENIVGIVTETGGKTSHSAILARALGIPAVLGCKMITLKLENGGSVIVDGGSGEVIEAPSEDEIKQFTQKRDRYKAEQNELKKLIGEKTKTADGREVLLYANIGRAADAKTAASNDCEGIGLFRTEFLFMDRTGMPDEDEQYRAYSEAVESVGGKEVIIRTLDVGGDKDIPYLKMEKEENPFLGHRAIRYCLDREDIFRVQLKAILRAGTQDRKSVV